ncbi:MAG: hypothetical protein H6581_08050 [Bacteroidia bacterium]|nr:hypothetical protein [Bacteroidia bacterium]
MAKSSFRRQTALGQADRNANWDDEIFAGRNQAYGAFLHRREANLNLFNALVTACGLLVLGGYLAWDWLAPIQPSASGEIISCPIHLDLPPLEEPGEEPQPELYWDHLLSRTPEDPLLSFFNVKMVPDSAMRLHLDISVIRVIPVTIQKLSPHQNELISEWAQTITQSSHRKFVESIRWQEPGKMRNERGTASFTLKVAPEGKYLTHWNGPYEADHQFRTTLQKSLPAFRVPPIPPETGLQSALLLLKCAYFSEYSWSY